MRATVEMWMLLLLMWCRWQLLWRSVVQLLMACVRPLMLNRNRDKPRLLWLLLLAVFLADRVSPRLGRATDPSHHQLRIVLTNTAATQILHGFTITNNTILAHTRILGVAVEVAAVVNKEFWLRSDPHRRPQASEPGKPGAQGAAAEFPPFPGRPEFTPKRPIRALVAVTNHLRLAPDHLEDPAQHQQASRR